MKHLSIGLAAVVISISLSYCKSGLVTTSNSCYNAINDGKAQNKAGNFTAALDIFNAVLKKCDAYDAKEAAYAGKAEALNGLHQYSDALTAASEGLKTDRKSIDNLFEKANAESGLGMHDQAKTDLNMIVGLTEKNQNVRQRATIFAKIAESERKQQLYDQALQHIAQAISFDNTNLSFYMQRGDINAAAGYLSAALNNYDEAISKGKDDAEAWRSRTITLVRLYQKKYGTDNGDTLNKKLNSADRQALCNSIRTSQAKGMKDVNIDLLQTAVCK